MFWLVNKLHELPCKQAGETSSTRQLNVRAFSPVIQSHERNAFSNLHPKARTAKRLNPTSIKLFKRTSQKARRSRKRTRAMHERSWPQKWIAVIRFSVLPNRCFLLENTTPLQGSTTCNAYARQCDYAPRPKCKHILCAWYIYIYIYMYICICTVAELHARTMAIVRACTVLCSWYMHKHKTCKYGHRDSIRLASLVNMPQCSF